MKNNFDLMVKNLMLPTKDGGSGMTEEEAITTAAKAGKKLADDDGIDWAKEDSKPVK